MTDPKEIIEKLTKEQLADISGNGRSLSASEAAEYQRLGLMRISFEGGGCGAYLTPLGLAVRSHLQAEAE